MPSEGGVIDRAKQARDESSNILEFGPALCAIFVTTVGCLVFMVLLFLFPLIMLIIGSIYVYDCPAQKYIPIFLIVAGVFGVLKILIVGYLRRKSEHEEIIPTYWKTVSGIYQSFLFIWFILGCVWTYGAYKPEYKNMAASNYCNETVYLTAFWSLTVSLVLLALGIGLLCCCCVCGFCCAAFFGTSDSSETTESPQPPKSEDV